VLIRLIPDDDALASHIENTGEADPSWGDLLEQPCMAVPQTIMFRPVWEGFGNEEYDKGMAFDFYSRILWT
jgi:hypothetical protein